MKKEKIIPLITLLLGLVGLGVSLYLSTKHLSGSEIGNCPIFGGGCGDVLQSKYSSVMGIPLAYLGVLFYSGIIILSALVLKLKKVVFLNLLALGALIGFVDSMIFVYIQGVLIGSYCFYCLISALTATLLFFTMLGTIIDKLLDYFDN